MTKSILTSLFFFSLTFCLAQQVVFEEKDHIKEVQRGTTVEIKADTAFVISKTRAMLLNAKLDELKEMRESNLELQNVNKQLLNKVKEVEKLVARLLTKMEATNEDINLDLNQIIAQLDQSLLKLKENNQELASHNNDLKSQINSMEHTIKLLRKEIRGIWWNGVTDKLVVGLAALTLGFVLGSV
ncbi:hypothetical protein E1176_18265 [Fulvivirga sp. RKSG066]|uniref:hypothetical protein n=1 Tax=Fulvivirga aurantia TaxID=2529383 RepID=UPI0012BD104E|nr:hypothetical protein [Fulvivirga aurantia]MTI22981.1 hypothetical protein [Fulvivirga aurantia]